MPSVRSLWAALTWAQWADGSAGQSRGPVHHCTNHTCWAPLLQEDAVQGQPSVILPAPWRGPFYVANLHYLHAIGYTVELCTVHSQAGLCNKEYAGEWTHYPQVCLPFRVPPPLQRDPPHRLHRPNHTGRKQRNPRSYINRYGYVV
jgi:hypothetical protein